jgi:integrase
LRHFADQALDGITAEDVEQFKTARAMEFTTVKGKEKGRRKKTNDRVRPATVNRELACLKALFTYVIKSNVQMRNPLSQVALLPEHKEQTRFLSFDEQEMYLAAASSQLRDIATLMLETGMRPEEVYRIRPENVNLSSGLLYNPFGKTKAARRRVPLNSAAKSVLARRLAGIQTPFVFPCDTDSERPVPKVNNAHDRAVKASGVAPFRLYMTCATPGPRELQNQVSIL